MKSLMTPKSFRIIKMLSLDYSENCAICKYDVFLRDLQCAFGPIPVRWSRVPIFIIWFLAILKKLCNDYQNEYSERKLKEDLIKKPVCHKKLNFSTSMNESEITKSAKSKSTEKKSKEIEKDPEQWNRQLSELLCKEVSVSLTKEGFQ